MLRKPPSRPTADRHFRPLLIVWSLAIALSAGQVAAEVVDLEIKRHESFAEGHPFGTTGAYEKITGSIGIEVAPSHPANRRVVDLEPAPTTASGKVRLRTDFFLLKPVDPARGDRCLLYDVNNRGNKLALAAFNSARSNDPTSLADAGNGFLMRQGYTILWCGWNGDVLPGQDRLLIDLPVAQETTADGKKTITGRVYAEIRVDTPSFSEPICWGNTKVYPAADLHDPEAALTMRPRRSAPPIEIPRNQWSLARWEGDKAVPDPTQVYLEAGFRPGWLYDLVYTARDPRVSGLGAVAVRDVVSFFKYTRGDGRRLHNPCSGQIDHACVFGISQSGRFINHFLDQNFNGDEQDRTVFDGAFVTYIEREVGGPNGKTATVRFLVDSGASYALLAPKDWQALGLKPKRTVTFTLADGTQVERAVSECHLTLPQGEGHTPVILGEPGDEPLLGVVTPKILGLVFNPFNRTLQPMRMLLA